MPKVICDITSCKYNSSCCCCPDETERCECTKDSIKIEFNENHGVDCSSYEESTKKETECKKCQIKKYGSIKIDKPIEFTIIDPNDAQF